MEKLIKLESVGSFYNKQTGCVYPIITFQSGGCSGISYKNDKPDLKMGMKISECSEEFIESLDKQDYRKIEKIHFLKY